LDSTLEELLAIEAIKRLKARYFRTMDTQDWEGFADCFTDDVVADFRDAPGELTQGRDAFVEELKGILAGATTVHHGHMPEIELVSSTEATGIWAMEDIVELPDMSLQGWGHYHERYCKENGQWRISHVKLTRLKLVHTPG